MSQQKATIATRFRRLGRLACWLWRTGCDLNSLNGSNSEERNRVLVKLGKGALEALDIELEAGIQPEHGDSCGTLVVANHVSWLDIFAISSVYPCSFIAKQEIGSWPVLGRMGKNAGTVFINRNSRRDIEPPWGGTAGRQGSSRQRILWTTRSPWESHHGHRHG